MYVYTLPYKNDKNQCSKVSTSDSKSKVTRNEIFDTSED